MRTRRASSQEDVQEGTARILDFDNVVSEQELETILETMEETPTHKTLEHNEQPEISEDEEIDSEEEKQNVEVNYVHDM